MTTIIRHVIVTTLCLQAFEIALLEAAKQNVQLSDSYLPVAMQVISHLTDQMSFEAKEEPGDKPPAAKPSTTARPTTTPSPLEWTTHFHQPGYYAPASPPKPSERVTSQNKQQNHVSSQNEQSYNESLQNKQPHNVSPQNEQQYNNPPENQQQYNFPTQNQQHYHVPTDNQQQYNFPAQNQQQYNTYPQNQQQSNISPQNQPQYNVLPENQQQYNFPAQKQQQYNISPQNQQQSNVASENQQQYNFPAQNQQQYGFSSENQQQFYVPAQNQQQFYVPAQNQQQYDFLSQYQQPFYVPAQNQQQYYIPPQIQQQLNVSQDQHQDNTYQQYNMLLQNQQQYASQQNQQYDVMTFDFPQYNPIQHQNTRNEEPLLSAHHEEVKPLMEPTPDASSLLAPHFDTDVDKISSRSKGFDVDELTEENLQYLSQNVREMIRMAHDPRDERLVDVWDGLRAHPGEPAPKGKLSSSNLRLLLLYDLLSREAKRQKLSDYSGFSPDVMKTLVESSSGGARAQLSMALSKMVDRHDCAHEYANNRAKEMVAELAKDESKLSSEIRYLQPLVYKY